MTTNKFPTSNFSLQEIKDWVKTMGWKLDVSKGKIIIITDIDG